MSDLDMTTDEIRAAYCDGRDMHSRVVALCDALDASHADLLEEKAVLARAENAWRREVQRFKGDAGEQQARALVAEADLRQSRVDLSVASHALKVVNDRLRSAGTELARLEARLDVALTSTDDLHEFVTDVGTKLDRLIELWRETEEDLEAETKSLQTTAAAWGRNVRYSDEQQARAEAAEAIFYRDYPAENAATARAMAIALDVCDQ